MKIFLAAPFTSMIRADTGEVDAGFRGLLESIAELVRSKGHTVLSSHVREDWGRNLFSPGDALLEDHKWVASSDLVIAIVGSPPSPGVQMELGIALSLRKKIIVIASGDDELPYLNRGLPDVAGATIIRARDYSDLLNKLDNQLSASVESSPATRR